jgi:hypothetical protein
MGESIALLRAASIASDKRAREPSRSAPAAFAPAARLLEANLQGLLPARGHFPIEGRLCGAGLVPFHLHETEAFAGAGEDIVRQVDRPDGPVGSKELPQCGFSGIGRQIANEKFFDGDFLL